MPWYKVLLFGYCSVHATYYLFLYLTKEKPALNTKKKSVLNAPKNISVQTIEPEFKRLKTACLGDVSKANRLLGYELKRDANITKNEAAKRAIERLARDRK